MCMKSISINKLQTEISRVMREVEDGEVFEVMRYSKPIAFVVSKESFDKLKSGENCKACVSDLRKIANKIQ